MRESRIKISVCLALLSATLTGCLDRADTCGDLAKLIPLIASTETTLQSGSTGTQSWDSLCKGLESSADSIQDSLKDFRPKEESTEPGTMIDGFINNTHEYAYELHVVCTASEFKFDPKLVNQFATRAQTNGASLQTQSNEFLAQYCTAKTK